MNRYRLGQRQCPASNKVEAEEEEAVWVAPEVVATAALLGEWAMQESLQQAQVAAAAEAMDQVDRGASSVTRPTRFSVRYKM